MIIPDNLSPLPVLPPSDDSEKPRQTETDGFVSEEAIRQILVGPMLVTPLVTSKPPRPDEFAGTKELPTNDDRPFVTLSADDAYPDEASNDLETPERFEPNGPHPALFEPRKSVPPEPRIEPRKGLRARHNSDRWWVLGMGVALVAIFGSGSLIEIISNEAVRRATISPMVEQIELPPVVVPKREKGAHNQPIVISNPEYPAP